MILHTNRKGRWKAKAVMCIAFGALCAFATIGITSIVVEDTEVEELRVANAELSKQYTIILVENNEMRRYCRWAALLEPCLSLEVQDTLDFVDEMIRQWKIEED